jgi:hypothetical protein
MALSLATGHEIAGRYHLRAPVSDAPFGERWRAVDDDGPEAWITFLTPPRARLPTYIRDGLLAALRDFGHPHARAVTDTGTHADTTFVATGVPPGQPLRAWLVDLRAQGRAVALRDARTIFDQVSQALAAAHRVDNDNPLVHGATLIESVTLERRGEVQLVAAVGDLGLLTLIEPQSVALPPGADPEHPLPSDDLFGVGALLAELLTGIAPGSYHDVDALMARFATARPEVDPSVWRIVQACLCLDPAGRPANMGRVREMIRGALWAPREIRGTPEPRRGDAGSSGTQPPGGSAPSGGSVGGAVGVSGAFVGASALPPAPPRARIVEVTSYRVDDDDSPRAPVVTATPARVAEAPRVPEPPPRAPEPPPPAPVAVPAPVPEVQRPAPEPAVAAPPVVLPIAAPALTPPGPVASPAASVLPPVAPVLPVAAPALPIAAPALPVAAPAAPRGVLASPLGSSALAASGSALPVAAPALPRPPSPPRAFEPEPPAPLATSRRSFLVDTDSTVAESSVSAHRSFLDEPESTEVSAEMPAAFLAFRDPPAAREAAPSSPPPAPRPTASKPPEAPAPTRRSEPELTPEIVHLPDGSAARRRSFTTAATGDLFGRKEETAAVDVETLLPGERAPDLVRDERPKFLHEETLTGISVRPSLAPEVETLQPRARLVIARPHTLPPPTANFPSPLQGPIPPPRPPPEVPFVPPESPFAQPPPMERTAIIEMPPPGTFSPPTLPVVPRPLAPVVTPPPPEARGMAGSDRDAPRMPVYIWWILGAATVVFVLLAAVLASR